MESFALLTTFRNLFDGTQYKHLDSSLGDLVASQLYEDLVDLGKSEKLGNRVRSHECVVNLANKAVGSPPTMIELRQSARPVGAPSSRKCLPNRRPALA